MIDNLSLALSHSLILLAVWRLLSRPDLDSDEASPPPREKHPVRPRPFLKGRGRA